MYSDCMFGPFQSLKSRIVIGGHFGSGKTEICLNLANCIVGRMEKTSIIDLDIANPYFRSREKKQAFAAYGISLYGNHFDEEITMELPALSADVRHPLEDADHQIIVDLGGDPSGAMILIQFAKYFMLENTEYLCVMNCNRPEIGTIEKAVAMMRRIEDVAKFKFTGLINNTHLLRETTLAHIQAGHSFCQSISEKTGLPVRITCIPNTILPQIDLMKKNILDGSLILPIHFLIRETWLDSLAPFRRK